MKNVLITGGLGFIGTALAKKIIEKKIAKKCILVDNFGGYINPLLNNFFAIFFSIIFFASAEKMIEKKI